MWVPSQGLGQDRLEVGESRGANKGQATIGATHPPHAWPNKQPSIVADIPLGLATPLLG